MSEHAARIARDHCLAPERVDAPIYGGRYRSLFPDLPALEADEAALHALGRPGGPCRADADRIRNFRVPRPTWRVYAPADEEAMNASQRR